MRTRRKKSEVRPNLGDSADVSPVMNATATAPGIGADPVTAEDQTSHIAERDEFERFFTAHYERLVRTLTAMAGDRDAAADAVQDAFVRAHLRWRRVQALDDPAGWVRRVAINRLNDHHRRQQRKRRLFSVLSARHETSVEPAGVDEFDRLLAALPRQQRAVTAMYYVDGLHVAEIAATLEISEGSVKSHLYDARQRLRRLLETEGGAPPGRPSTASPISPTISPTTAPTTHPTSSPWSRP